MNAFNVFLDLPLAREVSANCVLLVKVTRLPSWVSALLVLRDGALSREVSVPSVLSDKIPILVVNAKTARLVSVPSWVVSVCLVLMVNPLFLAALALTVLMVSSPSRVDCVNLVLLGTAVWLVPLHVFLVELVALLVLVVNAWTCALME